MVNVRILQDHQGLLPGQESQFTAEEAKFLAESGKVEIIVTEPETKKGK